MIEIFTSARVRILLELRERPHTISEIAKKTGYSKTTVSYHLNKLNELGFVRREERGKWVYYRITERGLGRLKVEIAAIMASLAISAFSAILAILLKVERSIKIRESAIQRVPVEKAPKGVEGVVGDSLHQIKDALPELLAVAAFISALIFIYLRFRK